MPSCVIHRPAIWASGFWTAKNLARDIQTPQAVAANVLRHVLSYLHELRMDLDTDYEKILKMVDQ